MSGYCLQCGQRRVIRADGFCVDCRRDNEQEERYGRYLDAGPAAWDDRDNPDY